MSKERNYKYDPPKLMLYFIFINNSNLVYVSVPPKTTTESTGCKCGVERRSTDNNFNRIMGGKKIDEKMKYPWLVPLWKREVGEDGVVQYPGWFGCGGTIIASNYVVSAAHCLFKNRKPDDDTCIVVKEIKEDELAVHVGDHNIHILGDDEHEQIVDIARIIKHPDYKEKVNEPCIKRQDFDIMILKLDKLLDLNIFTPACLPRPGNDARFEEKVATAAGWGRLSKFGNRPSEPHEIDLLVKNNCPAAITYPSIMCNLGKGVVWQGKGQCQGDSGGPFTYKLNGQHILIGVISTTYSSNADYAIPECGNMGGLCRVSYVREWIDQTLALTAIFCPNGSDAEGDE